LRKGNDQNNQRCEKVPVEMPMPRMKTKIGVPSEYQMHHRTKAHAMALKIPPISPKINPNIPPIIPKINPKIPPAIPMQSGMETRSKSPTSKNEHPLTIDFFLKLNAKTIQNYKSFKITEKLRAGINQC